jgi:hypothetical protein
MTKNKESQIAKDIQKKKNRDALLESYNISKGMAKRQHMKRYQKKTDNIGKVKRIDW